MYRFFVEPEQIQTERKQVFICGKDVNHIRNVLRMKNGEEILISAGDNREYTCAINALEPERILADILSVQETGLELPSRIYLFQGLPKSDKMELIIQKAVELGAYEIIPVATKRAVVKLDEKKAAARLDRWQKIAESAAKQSRRMLIPRVRPVMTFQDALEYAGKLDIRLIPYELAGDIAGTRELLSSICPGQSVGVFIGPEGGFAPEEVEAAMGENAVPITLGKRILRTETAGMTVLSILMFLLEGRQ